MSSCHADTIQSHMLLQIIGIVEIKGNNKNIEKITADSHYDTLTIYLKSMAKSLFSTTINMA